MSLSFPLAAPVASSIRPFDCARRAHQHFSSISKHALSFCHWIHSSNGGFSTRSPSVTHLIKQTPCSLLPNRPFRSHASHWQRLRQHGERERTQLMSKNKLKRRRASPSVPLMLALDTFDEGRYATFTSHQNKIDLSKFNPITLTNRTRALALKHRPVGLEAALTPGILGHQETLQSVLARFIERNKGNLKRMEIVDLGLNEDEQELIALKGFQDNDLREWAKILLLPPQAATQILTSGKVVPAFLFLLFLRRTSVPAICIEQLIWYIWRVVTSTPPDVNARITREKYVPIHQNDLAGRFMDVNFFIILVSRLARHARRTSLVTLGRIRTLVVEVYGVVFKAQDQGVGRSRQLAARMAFVFNRLLTLFSLPVQVTPMMAAVEQEKMQFDVLAFMSSYSPPLAISSEGYKALVRVQLAMPKTAEERQWALLKRKSWPPWKEDKTGLDAAITVERGISRSLRIIRWMQEAGYPVEPWMDPATIHAGWDTDQSPTIQTRTLNRSVLGRGTLCDIWTARIRSTRTLNEAWACFLAFQESKPRHPQENVYHAMFERMLFAPAPDYGLDAEPDDMVLPGDGKVVFPDPTSPYELTYVSRAPPNAQEFLKEMVSIGLRPSGRLLALLFSSADSVGFGLDIIEQGDKAQIHSLRSFFALSEPLKSAPDPPSYLVSAYLSLLCKAIDITTPAQWQTLTSNAVPDQEDTGERLDMIVKALLRYKTTYRPAWNLVFKRVLLEGGRTRIPWKHPSDRSQDIIEVSRFKFMQALIHRMEDHGVEIDEYVFRSLCKAAGEAGLASAEYVNYDQDLKRLRAEARMFLRMHLQSIVGAVSSNPLTTADTDTATEESCLLHPPQSFLLHSYVRALGLLRDYEGLYSFACFIVQYKDQLNTLDAQISGGRLPKTFREAIVALRVYTEQSWKSQASSGDRGPAPEVAALIEKKINSVPEWGGWPSDLEVEAYCEKGFYGKRWAWV